MTKKQMRSVYQVTQVYCRNCKAGFAPVAPTFTQTTAEIESVGHGLHSAFCEATRTLCGKPLLVVSFCRALMDAEIYAKFYTNGGSNG